ncbi:membrane-anchored protein [Phyllobacterium sp. 21LDTY02-6]|uniref:membrane-anchored protein n=1 Tax=Phyllobacterium sp. 21LDTY02-6 TaxID=2944903 RepID=UPI0020219216|nr:membrane-anchored protein [Phyllobacterium sp. 21LDTY02-6]MCO4319596.1 membrane-anchored protein [Phyllobacterium sp. 21LDTY02-6]
MSETLAEATKLLFRKLKYLLRRSTPPTAPTCFDGPVLVVGSAPVSHLPADFDDRFRVITINGSQAVTKAWGIDVPDITLMQRRQLDGTNTNAQHVRRVLKGERTGVLYVLLWREGRKRLEQQLETFDYRYADLRIVNRYERIALIEKVSGIKMFELDAYSKCSNGVIAVLFALYNGASAVIITGINPNSAGHIYNDANLSRSHVQTDSEVLLRLLEKGFPVYTTDPEVSKSLGMPLWDGKAEARKAVGTS